MKDFGENMDISSSFYACIAPRGGAKSKLKGDTMEAAPSKGIYRGESISSTSLTDSNILHYNSRIQNNSFSEVGKKLWK